MAGLRQRIYSILIIFGVCTLIALFFNTTAYLDASNEGGKYPFFNFIVAYLVRCYGWGLLFPFIFALTKRFGFESSKKFYRDFLVHIFFGILFCFCHQVFSTIMNWNFSPAFQERYPDMWSYAFRSLPGSLFLGSIVYAMIVFGSQAYLSKIRILAEQKKAAALQSELVQAQLQALKMQLQPHFLFNTLNSISSLVLSDPLRAHAMVAQLGDFLRLTLDHNNDQMVPLDEELRFLRSYLDIEQIRFSDRLKVEFNIGDDVLGAFVPHLVLQPIVENSIKHAIAQRKDGGFIIIDAGKLDGKLKLQIADSGPGREAKQNEKSGTGLANVRSRLEHIYGDKFDLTITKPNGEGMTVALTLPLNFEDDGKIT